MDGISEPVQNSPGAAASCPEMSDCCKGHGAAGGKKWGSNVHPETGQKRAQKYSQPSFHLPQQAPPRIN